MSTLELSTEILNSYDLFRLKPREVMLWVYAAANAAERNVDVPDWAYARGKVRMRPKTFKTALAQLISRSLVSADPPHALLRRGELWRISRDRLPESQWAVIRARIFARDDYTCRYCGERGGKLECDHVVPVAKGGSHADHNLVAACFACNRSKRDKSLDEWIRA